MQIEGRFHALDSVRAFALFTGIVLHATMSFMPGLIGAGWPIADNSPSMVLQGMFYVIHIFRMTLFFVIAGFFAHLMFHRKGLGNFLRDRAKRIVVPMVVGWAVLSPLVMLAFAWAITKRYGELPAAPPDSQDRGFELMHLWFLYYLLLMYVIALVGRWSFVNGLDRSGAVRARIDTLLAAAMRWHLAPLLLAAPIAVCLYWTPHWAMFGGIPTPDSGFTPKPPALVGFGVAFCFGWLVHRRTELLRLFERGWLLYAVVAIAATVFSWSLVVSLPMGGMTTTGSTKLLFAVSYTVATWTWVFALIGLALKFLSKPSAVGRYLADSSYWLYLLHLPLVFALQVAVMQWDMHWSVKFPAIVAVATALLLITYRYCVRYTYIGEVLNGRKYRREISSVEQDELKPNTSQHDASIVAELSGVRKRYDKTLALDGLDLQVRAGELLAILGPNGAGKSTAVSLMLGLQETDTGEVSVFGGSPHEVATRRNFGVMLQEVALAPELRVRELIDLSASYYADPLSVDEVLRLTHTSAIAARPYGKLSGGQKRLVQFAMAICGRPKLLFLDEPTVGLDIQARETMWATLRHLIGVGCSIVLTTHYLEEAEMLADRVAVLAKGRLVMVGSVDEVRARVGYKRMSCISRLDVEAVGAWAGVIGVVRDESRLLLTVSDADGVVRRLVNEDPEFRELEIGRAGLAEAFTELTQETA